MMEPKASDARVGFVWNPRRTAVFLAMTAMVSFGGALSHFVMIGLLGVPLYLVGVFWLLFTAIQLRGDAIVPKLNSIIGLLLVIGGWAVLSYGVAIAPDAFMRSADYYRHIHELSLFEDPNVPLCAASGPLLLTLGLWQRNRWALGRLALLWGWLMSFAPLTMLAFYLMRGFPITA